MPQLVSPLPEGPLDIIGDVHGELAALDRLLARLGCDPHAGRAERPLIFVGDLVDRGPDSPGVVRRVHQLAEAGLAWCVAGNHELNLLMDEAKEGNGWFFGHDDAYPWRRTGGVERRPFDSEPVTDLQERADLRSFLAGLPLALERPDLRVVHACWDAAGLSALPDQGDLAPLARSYQAALQAELVARGDLQRSRAERAAFADLRDPEVRPDVDLPGMRAVSLAQQARNPLKVLTSGQEEAIDAERFFYVGGKWRVVQRSRWWSSYRDEAAVVVGHYWRRRGTSDPEKHDLWDEVPPFGWAGPRGNVFCVDYSVGRRFVERWGGSTRFAGGLAALRWPERVLVFDDREEPVETTGFGGR